MRITRALAATAAATTALALAGPGVARAATTDGTPSGTHLVEHTVVPNLSDTSQVTDFGPLDPATHLQVTLHLAIDAQRQAAEFAAITNPASPRFGKYLSVDQYVASYGVPAATFATVRDFATAHGLSVAYTSKAHDLLTVAGTAAQVEQTFATPLHTYRTATGRTFRANTAEPTAPTAVDAVTGLETLSDPVLNKTAARAQSCAPGEAAAGACTGAITPNDLWKVYDQPTGNTGQGQQVAVIGGGEIGTVVNDLRGFEDTHHLRHVAVREVLAADDQTYTAGEGEWAMDSAASTGMAPGVDQLVYYFGNSLSTPEAFSAFADDSTPGAPMQATHSVGGCESVNYALGDIATEEPIFRQMAMEGKTLFVSTGDTGGSCTVAAGNGFANTGAPQVEWPASSDAVIAVGGTELSTDGDPSTKRVVEKAWDYTGGGPSALVQEPSWQTPVNTIDVPCATLAVKSTDGGPECRGLPDVASLSGDISVVAGVAGQNGTSMSLEQGYTDYEGSTSSKDAQGNVTYSGGGPTVDGGTSLSTPLWAGMWTRINAAAGGHAGFAAPLLYRIGLDATKDANDFFDVALGQNGQHQAIPRNATLDPTGWDYVSGLGVPDVDKLMVDVAGKDTNTAVVQPDSTAVTVSAPTVSAASCPTNGSYADPAGDTALTTVAPGNAGAVDITSYDVTEPTPGTLRFATTVSSLADDADTLVFEEDFTYGTTAYVLELDRNQPGDDETFDLVTRTDNGTTVTTTTVIDSLTGAFDDATNVAYVDLPMSAFNAAAKPAVNLADGRALTGLSAQTNTLADEITAPDDTDASTCTYVVGGSPAATLPDAPIVPLLAAVGALTAAAATVVRRRRNG